MGVQSLLGGDEIYQYPSKYLFYLHSKFMVLQKSSFTPASSEKSSKIVWISRLNFICNVWLIIVLKYFESLAFKSATMLGYVKAKFSFSYGSLVKLNSLTLSSKAKKWLCKSFICSADKFMTLGGGIQPSGFPGSPTNNFFSPC